MKKNVEPEFPLLSTAPREPVGTMKRRARVLIAEDDYAFRDMLAFAFEDDGYEVVAVADGYSLLETLGASLLPASNVKPFDLVVSDIKMPRWSGLVTLEKLSGSPMAPPIVVITAFGSDEVHQRAKQAGAVTVLDKPFDMQDLVELGRRVITQKSARSERAAIGFA
ncbi:MAG: response regulator [Deltaproteobacteria bacterium]|jgi:CheY-like chemotaxis protein|nr:response regulator [Deltaproteobacteria bacterium]